LGNQFQCVFSRVLGATSRRLHFRQFKGDESLPSVDGLTELLRVAALSNFWTESEAISCHAAHQAVQHGGETMRERCREREHPRVHTHSLSLYLWLQPYTNVSASLSLSLSLSLNLSLLLSPLLSPSRLLPLSLSLSLLFSLSLCHALCYCSHSQN